MTKRKFSKLMNKPAIYTATKAKYLKEHNKVMLKDIKHEGKLYADHAWINNHHALEKIKYKERIEFTATAMMYNDNSGKRKQGLIHTNNFRQVPDSHEENLKTSKERKLQTNIRKGYK